MSTTQLQDDIRDLLEDTTPADMQSKADQMPSVDRGRLSGELQSLAMNAIWKSAYLDARYGSGCGDQGHESAVKAANKATVGLRRVLGFTYPERGVIRV